MTPEPAPVSAPAPVERRQAVWPWLLMPLVALALFFVLFKLKAADEPLSTDSAQQTDAPAEAAPHEDAESH